MAKVVIVLCCSVYRYRCLLLLLEK